MTEQPELSDTLENVNEPDSSDIILEALGHARKAFSNWTQSCERIDKQYSLAADIGGQANWRDPDFDLFWASTEILKPAIYARPPVPVVSTRFSIRDVFLDQVSEIVERVLCTTLDQTCMDEVMKGLRDDLILAGRGVAWVTFEDDGHKRVLVEHLDNTDFLHEPARQWADVGWVARCAWMTEDAMQKRFGKTSGEAYKDATFNARRDAEKYGMTDGSDQAAVWEVWHRRDNRVYWVTEGVPVMLDDAEPHLDLDNFFPCPMPAYGTLKRRSLEPIPDFLRYQTHLDQINDLTSRIYGLLDQTRVKGIIPAGGDIATAVEAALNENDDDSLLIPVPAAAFANSTGQLVQFLPLDMFANTIQGLIQSRGQLINDFYELSGISDIMRGASDAQETLGAQQLKSQYGSIRIRDKVEALTRCARDVCAIAGEIIAENFDGKTLMEMAMSKMPTDKEIAAQKKELVQTEAKVLKQMEAQAKQAQAQMLRMSQMPQQQPAPMPPPNAQPGPQQPPQGMPR